MNNFLSLHSSYVYTFTRTSKNNSRKYILILETKYLENIWEGGGRRINKQTNKMIRRNARMTVTREVDRLFLSIGYFKRSHAWALLLRFLERSYEIESDRESFSPIRILRVRCLIHLVDELVGRYFSISRVYRRTYHTHTHIHGRANSKGVTRTIESRDQRTLCKDTLAVSD